MRSRARRLRDSGASARPGSLFGVYFSLLILISLISFPLPATASDADIEKSFQHGLHQNSAVVKKAKEKYGRGKPIHDEIASLKAQAENIRASHHSLLEKFSQREEEMSSLGLPPKAFERHQAMVDGYKKAVNEYLSLIENLSNQPSAVSGQLKKIETYLDKNLHKKKIPIHGSLPYRNLGYPARAPDASPAIKPACKGGDAAVKPDDTKSTAEAPISPEIAALAQSLNWNPVSIYEYVKNSIETEWY